MSTWDQTTARWRALARREVADRLYAEKQRAWAESRLSDALVLSPKWEWAERAARRAEKEAGC